jgi:hypothetical protein
MSSIGPRGYSEDCNPLAQLANQRAEEYFARVRRDEQARYDAAMLEIRRKLGLNEDQTLEEFVGLKPSREYSADDPVPDIDPELAAEIDYFFERITLALSGELNSEEIFPPRPGRPEARPPNHQ